MLRDYQQRAIDQLYDWFSENETGNPCLVLPTGAGKSHIVAAICKDAIQKWPETRILMLTHVKELIEQNASKMYEHWPTAPLGIYSASVGRKDVDQITFAGIQSVRKKANVIGYVDLIIIDECHLVGHRDEGVYRELIGQLSAINPRLRVIGLTATPWRLGHGSIDDGEALFDALIEPVTIPELIARGYLAPLRSKVTDRAIDVTGVAKRGGEYVESALQKAVDNDPQNSAIVDEIIARAEHRRSWLIFCAGVDHSHHIADCLERRGISAATITGATPKAEREELIRQFKAGNIRAMTNANVLTTGFDHPGIDLIAMLRPTMSPVLYVQMAGRGLRPKPHTDHCLVLDFAGVVAQHGPITHVRPPRKAGEGGGDAPVKTCPDCAELVHPSVMTCPSCGYVFEGRPKPPMVLHTDDIMGIEARSMEVTGWQWRVKPSKRTGNPMLVVTYYGMLSDPPITEYLCVTHEGGIRHIHTEKMLKMARKAGVSVEDINTAESIDGVAKLLNAGRPPARVEHVRQGKFDRVLNRAWDAAKNTLTISASAV
jgi:DNA repair protein RadD